MRIYNRYILALALLFSIINISMAALGQRSFDVYFTMLVIASLMVTSLFVYFSPGVRKALNAIGFAFFAGFLVIVTLKVIDLL
ncbi:MAG: hypothetical protein HY669_01805 [Chloroflexi bacterium]|nr:hypothetical protein [Chloroflexota bacterium]